MAVILTLGSILFTDFEVPESINFGGEQMLSVRKLVGGDRVVDAMGRDDEDIHWSGRFRGSPAEVRARLGDYLRIQGQELVLAWSSFRYLVVVRSFKADFQVAGLEVPYSIACAVIEDLTNPILGTSPSADAAINSDVNASLEATDDIGIPSVTSSVGAVSVAMGSIESFQSASSTQISGMQSSINAALGVVTGQLATQNAVVSAGISTGAPQTIAASLMAQSTALQQLSGLYRVNDLLARASINVANSGA